MRLRLLSLNYLRLLLAIAASEMEDRPNESEALAAKAVARAPASLLRALRSPRKRRLEIRSNLGCRRLRQWFSVLTSC